jgi:L-rhamnose mutarotase
MSKFGSICFFTFILLIHVLFISCQEPNQTQLFKRYCKTCDLVEDKILNEEYAKLLQNDVWNEIVLIWKEYGIIELQIYRFETRLLMIFETKLDFDLQKMESKLADLPQQKSWDILMKKYLKALPEAEPGELWVLSDRVYKLDQEKEYQAGKGYVERRLKEQNKRLCEVRELVNDPQQIEEYKYYHAMGRAWPEITQGLKNAGIKDMEIFMVGNRSFEIYDVEMDFDINTSFRKTRTSKSKDWGALVGKADRPILDKDGKRMNQFMERIY